MKALSPHLEVGKLGGSQQSISEAFPAAGRKASRRKSHVSCPSLGGWQSLGGNDSRRQQRQGHGRRMAAFFFFLWLHGRMRRLQDLTYAGFSAPLAFDANGKGRKGTEKDNMSKIKLNRSRFHTTTPPPHITLPSPAMCFGILSRLSRKAFKAAGGLCRLGKEYFASQPK